MRRTVRADCPYGLCRAAGLSAARTIPVRRMDKAAGAAAQEQESEQQKYLPLSVGWKNSMQRMETDPTERSMRQFLSASRADVSLPRQAMKKVLWSSVVAIVLVAAMSAVAFAVDVSGPDTVEEGQTITITVTGDGAATSGFVSTKGLRVTDASGGFSTPEDVLLVDSHGGLTATYKCVVTAAAGDSVAFDVTGITVSDGTQDESAPNAGWSARVGGEPEPIVTPDQDEPTPTEVPATETPAPASLQPASEPPTEQPSETSDQGEESAEPTDESSASVVQGDVTSSPSAKPSAGSKAEHLPKTADSSLDFWTYLVIGAGLAVVIVIAGKKVYARL